MIRKLIGWVVFFGGLALFVVSIVMIEADFIIKLFIYFGIGVAIAAGWKLAHKK